MITNTLLVAKDILERAWIFWDKKRIEFCFKKNSHITSTCYHGVEFRKTLPIHNKMAMDWFGLWWL